MIESPVLNRPASVYSFTDHPKLYLKDERKIDSYLSLPILDTESFSNLDDGRYRWQILGCWTKYDPTVEASLYRREDGAAYGFPKFGRTALCLLTGYRRKLTMGEFLGTSKID
ncbi:MAG: hypothetical protein MI864_10000 [Pseudomonadales bacterium]|nr:hypothetical protein [Pseudomonadales bacterium]